jgi:hypothetical protein
MPEKNPFIHFAINRKLLLLMELTNRLREIDSSGDRNFSVPLFSRLENPLAASIKTRRTHADSLLLGGFDLI